MLISGPNQVWEKASSHMSRKDGNQGNKLLPFPNACDIVAEDQPLWPVRLPGGAVLRAGQQLPLPHHLHHLLVGEAVVGLQAVAEDLPQHHSEGPDVRVRGVLAVGDGLGRHPADGQQRLGLDAEVVRRVDLSGQTQVRNLDVKLLAHEDVPSREVFVDVEVTGQVLHPSSHLEQVS